jgi:catechol 2,3-dioxygenase-like lactoylglutathione lyase family enzyme
MGESQAGQSGGAPQESAAATGFHHVHLNSTDPKAATEFYTRTFDVTKKASLAGFEGVQSENMYLLFDRVKSPPATTPDSAIWHFGWGSMEMEADFKKHLDNGVSFHTPITRLQSGTQFAYMKAPDGALVEINTASTRAFLHVHLYSAAPLCAADWYVKRLGATTRSQARPQSSSCEAPFAAPSEPLGVIRSPAASVRFGEVSLIIYPRQRPESLVSPRGHVVDHFALSVQDLPTALDRLRKSGVKVLEEPHPLGSGKIRAAMIEGPDTIAIELVETK